jgi:hypothetical protein
MPYPWSVQKPDPVLQSALDIAMGYLKRREQAAPYLKTEVTCARIILRDWRAGKRSAIWLANAAIAVVEKEREAAQSKNMTLTAGSIRAH